MYLNLLTMKLKIFLLFTLEASSASACKFYKACHCYDSDGSPNNTATDTICGWQKGRLQYDITEYGSDTTYQECFYTSGQPFWNCQWREQCQQVGATGDDSSCR